MIPQRDEVYVERKPREKDFPRKVRVTGVEMWGDLKGTTVLYRGTRPYGRVVRRSLADFERLYVKKP